MTTPQHTSKDQAVPGSWYRSGPAKWLIVGLVVATVAIVMATGRGGTDRVVEAALPAGTTFVAALERTVSTEHASVGQPVELRTTETVTIADGLVLPEGVTLKGEVTHAKGGGRIAGAPELTLRFTRLEVHGEEYRIGADPFRVRGQSGAKESALQIGGGAAAGAVVGAIAGDVVKGAVVGAAIGTGVAVATKGDQIVLPAGQKLRIRLAEPVTVRLPRTG
jgi:hypothetical protein